MKRIYKFRLEDTSGEIYTNKINMFLHVSYQPGEQELCLWAEVDTYAPVEKYRYVVVGTGWDLNDKIDDSFNYAGTAISLGGFVWHVYVSGPLNK